MLHQGEEKRQVSSGDALLVKGENEIAAARMDQEIRVLHPLRDALVSEQLADVVVGEKRRKLFGPDIGVDGHQALRGRSAAPHRNGATKPPAALAMAREDARKRD